LSEHLKILAKARNQKKRELKLFDADISAEFFNSLLMTKLSRIKIFAVSEKCSIFKIIHIPKIFIPLPIETADFIVFHTNSFALTAASLTS